MLSKPSQRIPRWCVEKPGQPRCRWGEGCSSADLDVRLSRWPSVIMGDLTGMREAECCDVRKPALRMG